jgi:hypothetical protein
MIYGTVRRDGLSVDLTENGWVCPDEPSIGESLNVVASPRDFSPADGDPMGCALRRAAELLGGTFEVVPLPGPPPGTVY